MSYKLSSNGQEKRRTQRIETNLPDHRLELSADAPAHKSPVWPVAHIDTEGEPMPRVRTRSVEWLLSLLTLQHGHAVDRYWLAGTLWLDSEEKQALHNVRDVLVHLRKTRRRGVRRGKGACGGLRISPRVRIYGL